MAPPSHDRKKPALPKFEPLPPTNILNRFINALLAPLFYLVFTLITSIVVVPIYVIIENLKSGGKRRGGRRREQHGDGTRENGDAEYPGQPRKDNRMAGFLREYGRSYDSKGPEQKVS
jgi:hypothetical protein